MDPASVCINILGQEEYREGLSQTQRKDFLREKYKEFVGSKLKSGNTVKYKLNKEEEE
jgi:hypothetical protein